jgi:putative MATE family efflux protein
MQKESKLKKLENTPILKSIFIMSLPVILGNLAMVVYNLTDAYFVGQLNDVPQLAAATYALPLMMIMNALGEVFGIGGNSFISRSLGAGKKDMADKAFTKAVIGVVFAGVIFSVLSLSFINEVAGILGASGDSFTYTLQYISVLLFAAPMFMVNVAMLDMIRAEGAVKLAMTGMIIGVGMNIVLDPIFIFVLGLGVKGAAIATVLGNACGTLFAIYCYARKSHVKFKPKTFKEKNNIYSEIIKVGLPGATNILLMSVSLTMTNNIAALYGDAVVAGMGLALRNNSIVINILLGFSFGVQPLIGYNYGKGDYSRVKKFMFTNMSVISILGTVLAAIFFVFAEPMISLFNSDPDVVYNGARGLRALMLCKPVISVFMVSMSSAQAMGKGMIAFTLSVCRQLLFFMVVINLLNYFFGYDGFIYAQAISDMLTVIISLIVITAFLKKLGKSPSAPPLNRELSPDGGNIVL